MPIRRVRSALSSRKGIEGLEAATGSEAYDTVGAEVFDPRTLRGNEPVGR